MGKLTRETSKFKFSEISQRDLEKDPHGTCLFILANLGKLQRKDPTIITWLVQALCLRLMAEKGFPIPQSDWTPPPPDAL